MDSVQASSAHAVSYLDLPQFKIIADTCGYPGDELIRQLAQVLQGRLRSNDPLVPVSMDSIGA